MKQGLFDIEPEGLEIPRLHQSLASVLVNRSPLHCWHKAFGGEVEEYDETTNRGTLCHALLLGGRDIVSVEANDWRTNAAKALRDEAIANKKIPVLSHKLAVARTISERVITELRGRGIELSGQHEATVVWQSPGGTWAQGRIDHLIYVKRPTYPSATIYDFKFCQSAHPDAIARSMITYGADIQAAAYPQAIETIYPAVAGRIEFVFVYVEVDPPHGITLARPAGDMRDLGRWKWDRACMLWRECLEEYGTKTPWPSYSSEVQDIHAPTWALNAEIIRDEIEERGNL